MIEQPDPSVDDGPIIGEGEGFIKSTFPNFGFIRTDSGTDLFFIPTCVDASVCRYKELKVGNRVRFKIIQHRRGLRARDVQRQSVS